MKFCSNCASEIIMHIPQGDTRVRSVCSKCNTIHYVNPSPIVGVLPFYDKKVLLCRRAIEPRYGMWTLPCGFMECLESAQEGAMRETLEEANARVEILGLHTLFSVVHVNQVYMIFLGKLQDLDFFPGEESLDVKLFHPEEIPWEEIAFSAVRFSLQEWLKDLQEGFSKTHIGFMNRI